MGILEALILITLLLLPLGELVRINIFQDVRLHIVDIAVGALFLTWLIIQIKNKKNILKIPNFKLIMLFPLIGLLSLVINTYWLKPQEFFIASLYIVRWISYVSLYFAIKTTNTRFKQKIITKVLVVIGLIITIAGFIQRLFYPSLVNFTYLQWDRHEHRLFSVFLDPNYTGAFLVLYLLFIASVLIKNFKKRESKQKMIFVTIAAATLIAIYLTYSRSAILMLLASAITFFIFINKKKYILILICVTLLFIILSSPGFYIENLNLFRTHSSKERITSAITAVKIIEKNPILGVGYNAYRYAQIKYNFREPIPNYSSHADAGTDNSFLFVVATTGIIGLFSYMYIWYKLLKDAYNKSRNNKNILSVCVFSSAVGLAVSAQFINSLFFWPLMIWMWVIFALMD